MLEMSSFNMHVYNGNNNVGRNSKNNGSVVGFYDQGEAMRNVLETSFRDKEIVIKPIEKTYRASKVL